jgi:hypothetical protein
MPALSWRHYVYITMLYMNAYECMPRICRISVLYLLEPWTQMKTYAPYTCQQILRRFFGVVRSLTMQARSCDGGLYWKMHGRCGCHWSRYGEYPRLIVMSGAYKASPSHISWLYWWNLCWLSRAILCNNHLITCICSIMHNIHGAFGFKYDQDMMHIHAIDCAYRTWDMP